MTTITEAEVEQAALGWLAVLGWSVAHGSDIAPETPNAVQVLGDETLRDIARQLVETVWNNVTIRLDVARERPRPSQSPAHPAQARVPAGQAGEGDTDRP